MNEIEQIGKAFKQALAAGEKLALATVVAVRGSAYRRAGARMLISDEGQRVGSVSGGCLERDVIRNAAHTLLSGTPMLRLYDSLDEDLAEGFALGCNGAVLVLIEPLNANFRHQVDFMTACLQQRRRGAIATVYGHPASAQCELGARVSQIEGSAMHSSGIVAGPLLAALETAVAQALATGHGGEYNEVFDDGAISAHVEVIEPSLRVIVFGAGHDVEPLVAFGTRLGWEIEIVASNGSYGVRERLRAAKSIYFGTPAEAVSALKPDSDSVVLLMSHNFPLDLAAFRALLPHRPRYIGLLGPRHRAERLLTEAEQQGDQIDEELKSRIFGPVGLDIGAETPTEVALAISAEVTAVCRQRSGGSARKRQSPLHEQHSAGPTLNASLEVAADFSCGLSLV